MLEFRSWLGKSGPLDWLVCVLNCCLFLSNLLLLLERAGKGSTRERVSYNCQACTLVRNDRISSLGNSEGSSGTAWALVRLPCYSVQHIWNHCLWWENRIDSDQFREVGAEREVEWLPGFRFHNPLQLVFNLLQWIPLLWGSFQLLRRDCSSEQ